jgi:hypothetical protein
MPYEQISEINVPYILSSVKADYSWLSEAENRLTSVYITMEL